MFYLALALLCGQTLCDTANVDFIAQKYPVQVVDEGHVSTVKAKPGRPTHFPIHPIVCYTSAIDQEQGTGGDRGNVRPPAKPVKPLKMTFGLASLDQEQGTGGDRGNVRPPAKPVKPLKMAFGLASLDQEQGTGGDRGNTPPPVKPVKPLKKTFGLASLDQEQVTGGDRGNVRPPAKPGKRTLS
jgi:hypothetical protein